ncbi:MAG: TolC family protein, partial [Campylobacteraceae bacterium]|nr:TolC family protein [Campylobacteraceae bacterium]
MRFLKSKSFFFLLIGALMTPSLSANESIENVLSNNRLEIFDLSRKKADEDSSILEKDWINQVIYKLTKEYGEEYDTLKSTISISQPIFKSGGIYKAIKYARASKKYAHLDITLQKKEMIKDAVSLLFQIKKQNIRIQKQNLLIKNAVIDVERKKEQVLNGLIDTSYLDNAILDANTKKNTLLDLNFEKLTLINKFSNLSNAPHDSIHLPTLSIIDKNNFLRKNLNVLKITADFEKKYQFKGMSISKYLPTLNVTYDYFNHHDDDGHSSTSADSGTTYGFN